MDSILFIAPQKEIAQVARKVFQDLNISIPIIIAKNEAAVSQARKYPNISVIVSRGGTARDLKKYTDKIIVDINISFADIFPSIEKLSRQGCKNIAIISNNHIIDKEETDLTINDTFIKIRPYAADEDVPHIIESFEPKIDGIIGDIKPVEIGNTYNIPSIYIESNTLSITKAVKEALSIVDSQQKKLLRLQTLQSIINNIDEGIIVYDLNNKPIFSNELGQYIINNNFILSGKHGTNKLVNFLNDYNGKILDINNEKMLLEVINLNLSDNLNNKVLIFQKVNAVEKTARKIQLALYQKGLYAKKTFNDILYNSDEMKTIIETAKQFAQSSSSILIYGETGTGKEGLAQSIHNASPRANKPFVSVNCASLPPTLIESELFGYVDGAFTGARKSGKKGLFELAHTGTIFLDEIGDLPLDIQSRLLRVIQEREIMRIGDDKIQSIDIRLICATNKNLKQLVREGKFRQDLYYRINVLRLTLPPLRNRREDIMLLMNFYLNRYSHDKTKILQLADDIKAYLINYPWYGNIRELKNVAEVLAFIYKDGLTLEQVKNILDEDIDETTTAAEENILSIPIEGNLKDMEKAIIRQLIEKKYSSDDICRLLGISKVTLWRKTK
ncbi:sigma 54-interacting transcriptional regulator [Megamonas hypermegale]|uniref:sigma 54-interacting transcriptional regulator n=1 Tax=Megamonas hypermegale TaxID=158847 RepID=UPI0026EED776|nr:sigma 54-interacting transcriptional regulator [Megamonas hypermegale]